MDWQEYEQVFFWQNDINARSFHLEGLFMSALLSIIPTIFVCTMLLAMVHWQKIQAAGSVGHASHVAASQGSFIDEGWTESPTKHYATVDYDTRGE